MNIIKSVAKPTTLYVLGTGFEGDIESSFGLTDDYYMLDVKGVNKTIYLETDVFVNILTQEELNKYRKIIYDNECETGGSGIEMIILHDYVGDIMVGLLSDDGVDNLIDNFDKSEYIMYQCQCKDEDLDTSPTIILSNPATITKYEIGEYFNLQKRRDLKLKRILR